MLSFVRFFLITLSFVGAWTLQADPVALVTAARGKAQLMRGVQELSVKMGDRLLVGDRVLTRPDAIVKLTFLDGSLFTMTGEAEIVIDDYAFGAGEKPRSHITVKHGVFEFLAGRIAKLAPENYRVETQTATIGVRGSGASGFTTDGRHGGKPMLWITTMRGHVLILWTKHHEKITVTDPNFGALVTAGGGVYPLPVDRDNADALPLFASLEAQFRSTEDWKPSPRQMPPFQAPLSLLRARTRVRLRDPEDPETRLDWLRESRGLQELLTSDAPTADKLLNRLAEEEIAKQRKWIPHSESEH